MLEPKSKGQFFLDLREPIVGSSPAEKMSGVCRSKNKSTVGVIPLVGESTIQNESPPFARQGVDSHLFF